MSTSKFVGVLASLSTTVASASSLSASIAVVKLKSVSVGKLISAASSSSSVSEAGSINGGNGAAGVASFAKLNGLSLAAYPLHRAMTDLNVRLNGNGKSIAPWELVGAFNHTHDSIEYRRLNTFPSQPDNYNTREAMMFTGGPRVALDGNDYVSTNEPSH